MLIQNKPIRFIHIPKTGGTTVRQTLAKNNIDFLFGGGKGTGGHRPAHFFKNENSFKFCVVRNPYTRAVSYYNYLKRKHDERGREFPYDSFENFIIETLEEPDTGYKTSGMGFLPSLWIPQSRYIYDKDKYNECLINKIFKIEDNFNDQFKKFFGLTEDLETLHRSTYDDPNKLYTETLREIIYNNLKVDFDLLGYKK